MSDSGDLLLWVGGRRPLTSSSQELLGQSLPNLVCSICRVRRQEIVNFNDRQDKFGLKCVQLTYFFKKSSSLLLGTNQTN